jgi:hypothetical protein
VGQVFNLRRIVNPPAALVRARHGLGESPTPFAACRYVGQAIVFCGLPTLASRHLMTPAISQVMVEEHYDEKHKHSEPSPR